MNSICRIGKPFVNFQVGPECDVNFKISFDYADWFNEKQKKCVESCTLSEEKPEAFVCFLSCKLSMFNKIISSASL